MILSQFFGNCHINTTLVQILLVGQQEPGQGHQGEEHSSKPVKQLGFPVNICHHRPWSEVIATSSCPCFPGARTRLSAWSAASMGSWRLERGTVCLTHSIEGEAMGDRVCARYDREPGCWATRCWAACLALVAAFPTVEHNIMTCMPRALLPALQNGNHRCLPCWR